MAFSIRKHRKIILKVRKLGLILSILLLKTRNIILNI